MTRKDYIATAKVIREVFEDVGPTSPGLIGNTPEQAEAAQIAVVYLAGRLADEVFAPDNERFDAEKFLEAAIPAEDGPLEIVV